MNNLLDGTNELLRETVDLLGDAAMETLFVGGWGPYIRNTERHPGTKDVDILFPKSYSRDDIKAATQNFLDAGFFLSAKHDFQLFRQYKIGNHTYIFNVDLLHPAIQKVSKAEFVDVIDLDITFDGTLAKKVKTICIVGGNLLFDHSLYVETEYRGQKFNTLSPAGIVLSKLQSCHNAKRSRDIFDIHLSLLENPNVGKEIDELANQYDNVSEMLDDYRDRLKTKWFFYEQCLTDFGVELTDKTQNQLVELAIGT